MISDTKRTKTDRTKGKSRRNAQEAPGRAAFPVIGIGASAGGLEPVQEFLDRMPTDSGAALVLIQHLDPNRPSHLAELLRRHTRMPVLPVGEATKLQRNTLYVIGP